MFKDLFLFMKDIYQNRKLLLQFSVNDFKSRYAGSFLGILWAFINPVFTVLIYWLVFGFGLKAAMTDGKYPFIVYLITGMVPWFFFSDAFTSTTLVFREYTYLVKKVVFNIRILPLYPSFLYFDWVVSCGNLWDFSYCDDIAIDLLFVLYVRFFNRIDLVDCIDPTLFTRFNAADHYFTTVDHVDIANPLESSTI